MKIKKILELIKVIGIGIIILFALNMVINFFSVNENSIRVKLKDEYNKKYNEKYIKEIKLLKSELKSFKKSFEDLSNIVKKRKIEHTHYINYIVENEKLKEKFSKTDSVSYWFYSYADQGYQDYKVIKMEGTTFNFDKAMKIFREDGEANKYGGINSVKRITYAEYMSAHENRRI